MNPNNNKVTIIKYHYVRDLINSRYPEIKGLNTHDFISQIDYLLKYYNFITMEQLLESLDSSKELPNKAVLLTFDDAYIDHYHSVLPILSEKGIQGSFYIPWQAIIENKVLDVNKIHFILASENDKSKIILEIRYELDKHQKDYNLKGFDYYYNKLALPGRYDPAEIMFIKRLLQTELNVNIRKIIVDNLFERIVGLRENVFCRELYMSLDQIKFMKKLGMHIGNHGFEHSWLGNLTKQEQYDELTKSLDLLKSIGCRKDEWTMCFPYGSHNSETLVLLKNLGCKLALTTNIDIADIYEHNRYLLPRLDTNDIPKLRNALPNKWYQKN